MKKKTVIITGVSGQDGAYLANFLIKKNYRVIGVERRSARSNNWRLEKLGIDKKVIIEDIDIKEFHNVNRLFEKYKIDEIYNLAAQSFVKSSFDNPIETANVNALAVLNFLEIIRSKYKNIKFYQASTSEMFGKHGKQKQDEKTIFHPRSPYATSKTFAHYSVQNYREAYNIFAVNGILFNHESPLRGEEFITRKVTLGLAKIKMKKLNCLSVGNLYAKRDWGYAGDYVEAMWKMLQRKTPKDYVISTGKYHSIKDLINISAKFLKLKTKWLGKGINERLVDMDNDKIIVKIDKKFFRPADVDYLNGNSKLAKIELNWSPKTNFKKLIEDMIKSDLDYIKNKN
jgi:GDPmannose 4,6-dehydratase